MSKHHTEAGNSPTPHDPIVRKKPLAVELGVSPTTIWRWEREGLLPKPIKIAQTAGWPRSVIDAWKVEQGWPAPTENDSAEDAA